MPVIIKENANFIVQKWELMSFTACLIEGQEAKLLKRDREIDAKTALKLEFLSRSSPVVQQLRFNGNANKYRRFIKYFIREFIWIFV